MNFLNNNDVTFKVSNEPLNAIETRIFINL